MCHFAYIRISCVFHSYRCRAVRSGYLPVRNECVSFWKRCRKARKKPLMNTKQVGREKAAGSKRIWSFDFPSSIRSRVYVPSFEIAKPP